MKYTGKKLPTGFIYILNKEDVKDIENITRQSIESVCLDGTSYSETKMAQSKSLIVVYIKYIKIELNIKVELKLYGVRESHFTDKKHLGWYKEKVKTEVINRIHESIKLYQNNKLGVEFDFISASY